LETLFQPGLWAVHFAHQNLVVHRDIKPGNILVTADGTAKLLDFGVAKLLSPMAQTGEITEATARVMTPEYASPEQARGETITTASDVYSLGVLLYELLTGHRPYSVSSRSLMEVIEAICEQEPIKPSTAVGRTVTSPAAGGSTAVTLSASKFMPRHKAGVAAAALVIITLLAGAATTIWQARVARQARDKAERRFKDVRNLTNSFLFDFHDSIADLNGATKAREMAVKKAQEYLDSLAPAKSKCFVSERDKYAERG
jgi:eukaryotic-like serine/threonine-protein kinase